MLEAMPSSRFPESSLERKPATPQEERTFRHDESLLRYLGELSVEERLALNDAAIRSIQELRAGFAATRAEADGPTDP